MSDKQQESSVQSQEIQESFEEDEGRKTLVPDPAQNRSEMIQTGATQSAGNLPAIDGHKLATQVAQSILLDFDQRNDLSEAAKKGLRNARPKTAHEGMSQPRAPSQSSLERLEQLKQNCYQPHSNQSVQDEHQHTLRRLQTSLKGVKEGYTEPNLGIVQKKGQETGKESLECFEENTNMSQVDISYIHEQNMAHKLHQSLRKADKYLDAVLSKIELHNLYKVVDFLVVDMAQEICPVLLLISNKELCEMENKIDTESFAWKHQSAWQKQEQLRVRYLLQVWRKSDNVMLYERRLRFVPKGWGIYRHNTPQQEQSKNGVSHHKESFYYMEADFEDSSFEMYGLTYDPKDGRKPLRAHKFYLPDSLRNEQFVDTQTQGLATDFEIEETQKLNEQRNLVDKEDPNKPSEIDVAKQSSMSQRQQVEAGLGQAQGSVPAAAASQSQLLADARPGDTGYIQAKAQKIKAKKKQTAKEKAEAERLDEEEKVKKIMIRYLLESHNRQEKGEFIQDKQLGHETNSVNRNICVVGPRIFVATKKSIYEFNLDCLAKAKNGNTWQQEEKQSQQRMDAYVFDEKSVKVISIQTDYQFIQFVDIGNCKTAMILQHEDTKQIRFVLIQVEQPDSCSQAQLVFKQLGIVQKRADNNLHSKCDIVKICSASQRSRAQMSQSSSEEKMFNVNLVLRAKGQVEVYADFELTHTFNLMRKEDLFCVDLQADSEYFFLKFLDMKASIAHNQKALNVARKIDQMNPLRRQQVHAEVGHLEPVYVTKKVSHQWRSRIDISFSKDCQNMDFASFKLKPLNNFMRLYSSWQQLSSLFIVCHRNYISVYNLTLKGEQRASWVQHHSFKSSAHVREVYLEKINAEKVIKMDANEQLRFHARPVFSICERYVVKVIQGRNTIHNFMFSEGKLKQTDRPAIKFDGSIVNYKLDQKYRTGILFMVVSDSETPQGSTLLEPDQTDEERKAMKPIDLNETHYRTRFVEEGSVNTKQGIAKRDHVFYQNVLESERQGWREKARNFSLVHSNYEHMKMIFPWDQSQSSQQVDIDADCEIEVVITNKSYWTDRIEGVEEEEGVDQELLRQFKENLANSVKSVVPALLIYKKNCKLQVIPFFKVSKADLFKGASLLLRMQSRLQNSTNQINIEENYRDQGKFHLVPALVKDVLEPEVIRSKLKDLDLVMLRFVVTSQSDSDIPENCFILTSKTQLHAFDVNCNEVARITGLNMRSAMIISSSYLYNVSDFSESVQEQYASAETDYELTPLKRGSGFQREQGFWAINFKSLFRGKFCESWVYETASGLNSQIRISWSSDSLMLMQSVHQALLMPFPHYNQMSFQGMGSKNKYLIWKQSSDGFFTALQRNGSLKTWSSFTGKLLWTEAQPEGSDCAMESLRGYSVYRSDRGDKTYLGQYYNKKDALHPTESYSLTLLVSLSPVHKQATYMQMDKLKEAYETLKEQYRQKFISDRRLASDNISANNKPASELIATPYGTRTTNRNSNMVTPGDAIFESDTFIQHEQSFEAYLANKEALGRDPRLNEARAKYDYANQVIEELVRQAQGQTLALYDKEESQGQTDMFKRKTVAGVEGKPDKQCKFQTKLRRTKFYHFKVLKLRQHEDVKRSNEFWGSKCTLLFHFFHKLLAPFESSDDFKDFHWALSQNIKHRLYLSHDATRMLEVIQNRLAVVYDRQAGLPQQGELVKWESKGSLMPNFPFLAFEVSSLPYFISSDFKLMCDYDYSNRVMKLVETGTGKAVGELPVEALGESNQSQALDHVKQAFAQVALQGSEAILTLNKNTGLMTRWPIKSLPGEKYQLLTHLGEAHMTRYFGADETWFGYHYFMEQEPLPSTEITRRIQNRMCFYQQRMNLRFFKDGPCYFPEVASLLDEVDFSQEWGQALSNFSIERAFTWLDWQSAERVVKDEVMSFTDLQADQQLRVIYSTFPMGNSFLRMLALTENQEDATSKPDSFKECNAIFDAAEDGFHVRMKGEFRHIQVEVPLITDFFGLQPLDYAFGLFEHIQKIDAKLKPVIQSSDPSQKQLSQVLVTQNNHRFVPLCPVVDGFTAEGAVTEDMQKKVQQSKNLQLVQAIFNRTKDYMCFSNTFNMVNPIIKGVRNNLPEVFQFLNARLKQTTHIPQAINTSIRKDKRQTTPALGEYGLAPIDDLTYPKVAQDKLFVPQVINQSNQTPEKQRLGVYDYFWFDVPLIFSQSEEGFEFIRSLQRSANVDVYSNPAVQMIVANQWRGWQRLNFLLIFLPMTIQLICFSLNSCVLMPNYSNADKTMMRVLNIISLVLALYQFIVEMVAAGTVTRKQLSQDYRELALNFASPLLIITCTIGQEFITSESALFRAEWYWELLAWTAFVLWFRFLLMLRYISWLSPAISMVTRTLKEMYPFVVILMIGILAFADAFQSLQQIVYIKTAGLEGDAKVTPPFSKDDETTSFTEWKNKWFGEWLFFVKQNFVGSVNGLEADQAEHYTDLQWLLFIIAIIFTAIILMNLLLSLVAQIHGEVHSIAAQYVYEQLVYQMVMLQRINKWSTNHVNQYDFLLIAKQRKEVSYKSEEQRDQEKANAELNSALDGLQEQLADLTKQFEKGTTTPSQKKKMDETTTSPTVSRSLRRPDLKAPMPTTSPKNRSSGFLGKSQRK